MNNSRKIMYPYNRARKLMKDSRVDKAHTKERRKTT